MSNWEIVLIQYYNFDKCNDFVIGILTYRGKYSEENREHQEEDSCRQAGSKMAPRRGKRETRRKKEQVGRPGKEEGSQAVNI
jgi:hypothetical protein